MTERRSLSLPPPLFAVVPAAGVGARMGAGLPKQYLTLQGRTLAEHTLGRLLAFAPLQAVVVAVADGDPWWPELAVAGHPRVTSVTGGNTSHAFPHTAPRAHTISKASTPASTSQ